MLTVELTGSEITWKWALSKHVRTGLDPSHPWVGPPWANILECVK